MRTLSTAVSSAMAIDNQENDTRLDLYSTAAWSRPSEASFARRPKGSEPRG
jgi:hypothetical protein